MSTPNRTLRSQLLRWLLVPLSVIFLLDVAGSYFFASGSSDRVYDRELMEIARELALHVKRSERGYAWDLERDAERALLLDQYDRVYYAVRAPDGRVLAGRPDLPAQAGAATRRGSLRRADRRRGRARCRHARRARRRTGRDAVEVAVAETLVKRDTLARAMLFRRDAAAAAADPDCASAVVWARRHARPAADAPPAAGGRSALAPGSERGRRARRAGRSASAGDRGERPHGAAGRGARVPEPLHRRRRAPAAHAGGRAEGAHRTGHARRGPGRDAARAGAPLYRGAAPVAPGVAAAVARAQRAQHGEADRSSRRSI